jgi:hypothetical protein
MEKQYEHRRHSGSFWAYVLIIVGLLWILKQSGWDIHLPGIGEFLSGIGRFFGNLVSWSASAIIPLLILFLGVVLIFGRKLIGALLFVLLLLILLPHFLIIPGILMIIFFPVILIILGIVILTKLF